MIPLRNLERFARKFIRQPGYGFSVLAKRLKAGAWYRFGRGRSPAPEAITLFLTYRCNLRCKMCGQWGESGVTRRMDSAQAKEDLPYGALRMFIDEVAGLKPNITLFGGEPLLYAHCMELIEHIKSKSLHCLMISNGALAVRSAAAIVRSGLDEFNLSLDGPRGLHDEIRGMPGLFDMIVSGIQEIQRIKKETGSKKPLINLQCTITKYNYLRLQELVGVAEDIGADSLTYHNLIFLDKKLIEEQKEIDKLLSCSSAAWEGFAFAPEIDVNALYDAMQRIQRSPHSIGIDFYPNFSLQGLKQYYSNPSYLPSEYKARCLSPWIVAYVFPDGEVRPCLNSTYSFGNITTESFLKIWNSPKAVTFRQLLKKNSIFPACARCTELYRY